MRIFVLLFVAFHPLLAQQREDADNARARRNSAVSSTNSMEVLDASRNLRAGDRLSMRVIEDNKRPVNLIVTDSGDVEVPLIGRVGAKGRTCKQLAYAIKGQLEQSYYYKATVIIGLDEAGLKSPGRIYLTGCIKNQGPMEIPADENLTVSRAILRAGGFSDFANRKKVKLIRQTNGSSETKMINVEQVIGKGRADLDVAVQPDDTILVPEKMINF